MAEILDAQLGDASAQEVVFAYDVSILSNGKKYDLEEYGDSVAVSISNVDAEDLTVTHVKIDVTDGNGGLDTDALNEAKTVKQESETLEITAKGDEVFFDLTSCSIISGSRNLLGAGNDGIDVTVNVNWSGDTVIDESLAQRPTSVSFTVEAQEEDGTWAAVTGDFTVSQQNNWSATWELDGDKTYRVTENPDGLIREKANADGTTTTEDR